MYICKWCSTPIRKDVGEEDRDDRLACWIHVTGFYQCPDSRSEYDLATFDPNAIAQDSGSEEWTAGAGI